MFSPPDNVLDTIDFVLSGYTSLSKYPNKVVLSRYYSCLLYFRAAYSKSFEGDVKSLTVVLYSVRVLIYS